MKADYALFRPPTAAVGLTAVRAVRNGAMRQYTAVEFTRGWNGVEHFVRTLWCLGFIRMFSGTDTSGYAVLDVLDADGDIIGDYDIITAQGFAFVYRKLRLRVVPPPPPSRAPTTCEKDSP